MSLFPQPKPDIYRCQYPWQDSPQRSSLIQCSTTVLRYNQDRRRTIGYFRKNSSVQYCIASKLKPVANISLEKETILVCQTETETSAFTWKPSPY